MTGLSERWIPAHDQVEGRLCARKTRRETDTDDLWIPAFAGMTGVEAGMTGVGSGCMFQKILQILLPIESRTGSFQGTPGHPPIESRTGSCPGALWIPVSV